MAYKQITEKEKSDMVQLNNDHDFNIETKPDKCQFFTRLTKALYNKMFYYIILGIIIIIAVIVLRICFEFNFKSFMHVLSSLLNIYGLFMYIITIGIGLAQTNITFYQKIDPVYSIRKYSIQINDEENIDDKIKNQLLNQLKKLEDSFIHKKLKQLLVQVLYTIFTIFSCAFSIFVLIVEWSYLAKINLLQAIFTAINNKIINQIILFLYIGLLSLIGIYTLTCMNISSLFRCNCCKWMVKKIPFLNYNFDSKNTDSMTFDYWSTYIQRLIPTIAYHCQKLASKNNNNISLEIILGKLDDIKYYSSLVKFFIPLLLTGVFILRSLGFNNYLEKEKIKNGLKKFKKEADIEINDELEKYIVYDVLIKSKKRLCCCNCNKSRSNDNTNDQIRIYLNDFHKPSENPNDFDDTSSPFL